MIEIVAYQDPWPIPDLAELNKLLQQLSPGKEPLTIEKVAEVILQPNIYFFAARNHNPPQSKIVGLAMVFFVERLEGWLAEFHTIVVDENYRGQGIGKKLLEEQIKKVERWASFYRSEVTIYLTSNSSRAAAIRLYEKMGFECVAQASGDHGTNLFRLVVTP